MTSRDALLLVAAALVVTGGIFLFLKRPLAEDAYLHSLESELGILRAVVDDTTPARGAKADES